jgi:hypothetical protein
MTGWSGSPSSGPSAFLKPAAQVQLAEPQLRHAVTGPREEVRERLAQRRVEVGHHQPRRPLAERQELLPVGLGAAGEGGQPPDPRPAGLVVTDGGEDVEALTGPRAAVDAELARIEREPLGPALGQLASRDNRRQRIDPVRDQLAVEVRVAPAPVAARQLLVGAARRPARSRGRVAVALP